MSAATKLIGRGCGPREVRSERVTGQGHQPADPLTVHRGRKAPPVAERGYPSAHSYFFTPETATHLGGVPDSI
jgi:hypothetical protein